MADVPEFRTFGPPGTGKTTWLAARAELSADKFGTDQVSICSLTNAAVSEAAGRDISLGRDSVTTLHARVKRSLSAPPPAESRVKEFVEEYPQYSGEDCLPPSLLRARHDDDLDSVNEAALMVGGGGMSYYEQANVLRQQMIPRSGWPLPVNNWYAKWEDFCLQINSYDYTGWLETALKVRPLPSQQVVYVDEAQDHTPLQLEVVRTWHSRYRVLIGDDDQNLYEWAGAVPDRFFLPELPESHETVLHQSYRVPRAVHHEATRWLERLTGNRKAKEYLPRDADGAVRFLDGYGFRSAGWEGMPPGFMEDDGTYMFLASCHYMLKDIGNELRRAGVPYHNPYKPKHQAMNPLSSVMPRLEAYMKPGLWTGSEILSWIPPLKEVFHKGRREPFLDFLRDHPDDQIPLDRVKEAFLPEVYARIASRDLGVFRDYRRKGSTGSWDYALRVMSRPTHERQPRVILGTIHSVKGGEADHVYLFPDLSRAGGREYMSGLTRDRTTRLFYVGMTRARESLTLCAQSSDWGVSWR